MKYFRVFDIGLLMRSLRRHESCHFLIRKIGGGSAAENGTVRGLLPGEVDDDLRVRPGHDDDPFLPFDPKRLVDEPEAVLARRQRHRAEWRVPQVPVSVVD